VRREGCSVLSIRSAGQVLFDICESLPIDLADP